MSKRILVVTLALSALMASNAFASRARILVDGTGDAGVILGTSGSTGSFSSDDAYNMFYNPAYVNDYKNWAIIEKSNFSAANNAVTGLNTAGGNGTTAEGGFVTGLGNFNLGIYLNRQDALLDAIYTGGGSTATQGSMRPVDVIFGGDAGAVKWGISATYSAYSTPNLAQGAPTTNKVSNDLVVKGGLEWNDFDPFVSWRALGTDYGNALSPKNSAIGAGLRYHWGEWTPYAAYRSDSYNGNSDYRAYGIGLARTMKATESVKMGYNIGWFRQSTPAAGTAAGSNPVLANGSGTAFGDRTVVPLNINVEADANSWLTLRAGIGYNFMDQVAGQTVADNTTGRIGATAHAGKADFDMAVGKNTASGSEGGTDTSSQNFDFSNGLFTAAAVSYHW